MAEPTLPPPDIWVREDFGLGDVATHEGYTAELVMQIIEADRKATRALALEEAARECESEAQDFSPDWGRQAIASANLCAIRVRALIGKE